jgi:hypothetical protein
MPRTITTLPLNLSWKAILAFLFPLLSAVAVAVASWIVSGELNANEIRAALGGLILSGLALLGAYVGKPGQVVQPDLERADIHDADGA